VVGTGGSGTLPTPDGPQSLLAQPTPPGFSPLAVIAQAFAIWAAAFPSGKITATLTNNVADVQLNTGTVNANPSGSIAGRTRDFTDAEKDARGGRPGVQITFDTSNFVWRPNKAAILATDPSNTQSLLITAIHEIGHALGLLHNTNTGSV